MPKFSPASFSMLSTCHHDLQVLMYEVIKTVDCAILKGYREQGEQDDAFALGRSKYRWPDSKHNSVPAMAIDVTPNPVDFVNVRRLYWFAGYVMGLAQRLKEEGKMTHSVRYGGDWDIDLDINDNNFGDLLHFELIHCN